ncbi:antibiotic biosynthesis monooxygenase [bacterium]|nr:antibiotic biosynthesis monooxygenase [bacterium]
MSKTALHVMIACKPGTRTDVIRALSAHRERCLRDEPGTLQFEIMIPADSDSTLYLFELYENDAALSAHSEGSSIARYRAEAGEMTENTDVHHCSLAG